MIQCVTCDLLRSGADIIAHQVNCMGVMGSGVARQIRSKYPAVYTGYLNAIAKYKENKDTPLGKVNFCPLENQVDGAPVYIANMFGQYNYGTQKRHTDYAALHTCLETLAKFASEMNMTVAIPFRLGCGLGGGDWENVVYPMIQKALADVDVMICRLE